MKFSCQVEINAPIDQVLELFVNPDNLKEWQDGFISHDHVSGNPGEKDAKSKFIYKSGRNTIELIETIRINKLPEEFLALYEAKQMINTMSSSFTQIDESKTLYTSNLEYISFHGFLPKLMAKLAPSMFQKQTQKWLDQFKEFVERTI